MRTLTRDKLAKISLGDQEIIRFFEEISKQSGVLPDGDFGDISIAGGTMNINPGVVGLNEVAAAVLSRANQTGTQLAATVSDFAEAVDDRVAALLQQSGSITLTYNDALGTLVIGSAAAVAFQAAITVPDVSTYSEILVANTAVTAASKITAQIVGELDAENDAESLLDDGMQVYGIGEAGQVRFVLIGNGPFTGPYKINYGVAA